MSFLIDSSNLNTSSLAKTIVGVCILVSTFLALKYARNLWFLASPFIIFHWWTFYSVLYIETGVYIVEQNSYGYNNGASILLAVFMSLFFTCFFFPEVKNNNRNFSNKDLIVKKKSRNVSLYLLVFSITVLGFGFIYNGSIPLLSSNRFAYFEEAPRIVKLVYLGSSLTSFISGIEYCLENKKRRILFLFLSFLCLIILSGDKFTGIFLSTLSFVAGYIITSNKEISIRRIFLWSSIGVLMILIIVSFGFLYMHEIGDANLFDVIIERALALQGHVFFGTYDEYLLSNLIQLPIDFFFKESTYSRPMGIDYLMYQVSDPEFASAMLDQGITFTMGFPAILFVFFNKPFVFISIAFFAFVFRFFSLSVIKHTKKLNYLLLIVYYLLFFILFDIFIMGRFWKFFEAKFLLFSSIIFFNWIYNLLLSSLVNEKMGNKTHN